MGYLRLAGETDAAFAKRRAYETGQLWGPQNKNGPNVRPKDLGKLSTGDDEMREAFIGLSKMMVRDYAPAFVAEYGAEPAFDGKVDKALLHVMSIPRCDVPDYAPPPGAQFQFGDPQVQEVAIEMQKIAALPAIGKRGNWPRCHSIGDFHCCVVQIDETNRPSWMTDAILLQVLRNVRAAYAEIGQWIIYVNQQGRDYLDGKDRSGEHVDTKASWVRSSSGWIGLAILTLDLGCNDQIWQQYLNTYQGGSTVEIIIRQNTKLWMHEHGHNSGLPHGNGFIMNPSIMNDSIITWTPADYSTATLKINYGGKPYVPGGTPPPTDPNPPTTIEQQLEWLKQKQFEDQVTNAVQDAKYQLLNDKYKLLEQRIKVLEAA